MQYCICFFNQAFSVAVVEVWKSFNISLGWGGACAVIRPLWRRSDAGRTPVDVGGKGKGRLRKEKVRQEVERGGERGKGVTRLPILRMTIKS